MASEGGAAITMAEESLKAEKGTASEGGAAITMAEESLKAEKGTASKGGAAITMAEESLKAEKGTASEVGAGTAKTMAERLKKLQDTNIRLCQEVEDHDSTLTNMLVEIQMLDMSLEREFESWGYESKEKLEKSKRKVTSGVYKDEISKRKTTKGQHAMKTPLPRLRLNQQETTGCASKTVNRMSGGPKI